MTDATAPADRDAPTEPDAGRDENQVVRGEQQAAPAADLGAPPADLAAPADDQAAREMAEKLRALAAVEPELARDLVAGLVAMVDQATAGAFGAQLSPAARAVLGLDGGSGTGRPATDAAAMTGTDVSSGGG